MRDERRDSRSERRDGYPREWRAKDHHRHEYEPCPRMAIAKKMASVCLVANACVAASV